MPRKHDTHRFASLRLYQHPLRWLPTSDKQLCVSVLCHGMVSSPKCRRAWDKKKTYTHSLSNKLLIKWTSQDGLSSYGNNVKHIFI